jgi:hypothetical protein
MSEILRLSDILGRGVTVEWFEAVALTREVAERVRENLGGQKVPELHQIELNSDGGVSLSGASRTEEPVRRLGQLLQAALVESDPPVQLRLLGSQATAPTPTFASIRQYIDALEYFERPDRASVLRGLYERVAAAPMAAARLTPTLDEIAPLDQVPPKKEKRLLREPPPANRRVGAAFAAAVVVVVGCATYWQFGGGAAPSTQHVSELAVKASDVVGTALVAGLSSVSDRVGLGRLSPSEGSGSVPALPVAPPKPDGPTHLRQSFDRKGKTPSFRLFDLSADVAAGLPITPLTPVPLPTVTSAVDLPSAGVPDSNVYSASDVDVSAPVGVRPQLPAVLPGDVNRENLSKIEVLILPDGTVASVKLIGSPRSVLEGMLLSAAKAWQFKPAMKGDQPVAYRKLVWLVLQ